MSKPVKVRVRMYQVGFGDCFLISVEYDKPLPDGRDVRHLLIDYGSTRPPREGRARGRMADVAKLIEEHTGGHLDVVAVTHRHRDHLSGFGDNAGDEVLRRLSPKRVLRPWTEQPDLQSDATGPALVGAASKSYVAGLAGAEEAAERLAAHTELDTEVAAAPEEKLRNAEAIKLLDDLSAGDRGRYLFAGADPGLEKIVPGLAVTVLGPPTVDQDKRVARQREDDEDEFWMLRLAASLDAAAGEATAEAEGEGKRPLCDVDLGPGPVRWLVERLSAHRGHSAARLVRQLDDALNNTSLVLLLEIGGLRMLFPGDAQIENWQFTLDKLVEDEELRSKLRDLDLYKVGHHGSRNATPKSLFALWEQRAGTLPPLTILMSTRPGVHGKRAATKVPRATLVTALERVGTVHSTDDLDQDQEFLEVEADVATGPFRLV